MNQETVSAYPVSVFLNLSNAVEPLPKIMSQISIK
jgi:hypothetical protein